MDTWIERHWARVEQRYRRLDAVLAKMSTSPAASACRAMLTPPASRGAG